MPESAALVVWLTQQIHQFRLRRKEFAMQLVGSEDQEQQAWRDFLAALSPQERLDGLFRESRLREWTHEETRQAWHAFLAILPPEARLTGLSAEERLAGLSLEERLEGLSLEEWIKDLSPEELERLRQLLQIQTKADNSSRPE